MLVINMDTKASMLRSKRQRIVDELLQDTPFISAAQIAAKLDICVQTANGYLAVARAKQELSENV